MCRMSDERPGPQGTYPGGTFGHRAGDDWVELASVPRSQRRAEVRCGQRHLVAVVSNDMIMTGRAPVALSSSVVIPVRCRACQRSAPAYDLDPRALRGVLMGAGHRPLAVRLDQVASVRA